MTMTVDPRTAELNHLRADIRVIAECLLQEALTREWCNEYDGFVDTVNGLCSEPHLEHAHQRRVARFHVNVIYDTTKGVDLPTEHFRTTLMHCLSDTVYDVEATLILDEAE